MALVQAARCIAQRAASTLLAHQQLAQHTITNLHQTAGGTWRALQLAQPHLQPQSQLQQQRCYASLGITLPSPLRLEEVMRVPLLEDKTAEEIEHIWLEHHRAGPATRLASTLTSKEWGSIKARATACPMFVLPLAKPAGGYQTMLLQWQLPVAMVTGLADFKAAGPNATPHLTITHYEELAGSKGVVLAAGDVVAAGQLSVPEAWTCMELIRAFYTDPESYQIVYQFNHDQGKFSFEELLRALGLTGTAGAAAAGPS